MPAPAIPAGAHLDKSPVLDYHTEEHHHYYEYILWSTLPSARWCVFLYSTGVLIHGVAAHDFLCAQQARQAPNGALPDNRSYVRSFVTYLLAHPVQSAVAGTAAVVFGAMCLRAKGEVAAPPAIKPPGK